LTAQNPYIQHFTTEDGLPSNTVYPIIKDSKYFLWFGTDAGVARYDGNEFTCFSKKDGLNSNEIIVIKEDLLGRIWFFNFNGTMNFFYQNKIYNYLNAPFLDSLKSKHFFTDFYQDTDETIYFYSFQSFEIISLNNQSQVRKYLLPSERKILNGYERATMNVKFISGSTDHGILLYTAEGLYALHDFSDTLCLISDTIGYAYAFKINEDKYLLKEDYYTDSTKVFFEYADKKIGAPKRYTLDCNIVITSAFETKDSILWLATIDKGVFLLKNQSILNHINIREAQGVILWKEKDYAK